MHILSFPVLSYLIILSYPKIDRLPLCADRDRLRLCTDRDRLRLCAARDRLRLCGDWLRLCAARDGLLLGAAHDRLCLCIHLFFNGFPLRLVLLHVFEAFYLVC